jgi:hypothetical protein
MGFLPVRRLFRSATASFTGMNQQVIIIIIKLLNIKLHRILTNINYFLTKYHIDYIY